MSDHRTPTGRFANFLKASEHWGPDLLLGRFVAGLPDVVIPLGDMRDTYAELKQLRAELAAATARAEAAETALQRVRTVAAHPSSTQGYIRGYVYAADVLAAIEQETT